MISIHNAYWLRLIFFIINYLLGENDDHYPSNFVGTSSNGTESFIKIELGSKEAERYYNRKDNSINNDSGLKADIYDDVEEEPIFDSEDEAKVNIPDELKDRLQRRGDQKLKEKAINNPYYLLARCKCGNNCVDNATHGMTMKLRESY